MQNLLKEIALLSPQQRSLLEEKMREESSFQQAGKPVHENNLRAENLALKIIDLRRQGFNVTVPAIEIHFSMDDNYDNSIKIK